MKLTFETRVCSADGQEIGKVKEVVVDPRSHEVVGLVIKQGLLFQDDRVIDVDLVASADDAGITLKVPAAEVGQESEEYQEGEYISLDGGDAEGLPTRVWVEPVGPAASLVPPGISGIALSHDAPIPIDDVGLLHGSRVVAQGGEKVGTVTALVIGADHKLTHLVMAVGMTGAVTKLVPLSWVVDFEDNAVSLAVPVRAVRDLPDCKD